MDFQGELVGTINICYFNYNRFSGEIIFSLKMHSHFRFTQTHEHLNLLKHKSICEIIDFNMSISTNVKSVSDIFFDK